MEPVTFPAADPQAFVLCDAGGGLDGGLVRGDRVDSIEGFQLHVVELDHRRRQGRSAVGQDAQSSTIATKARPIRAVALQWRLDLFRASWRQSRGRGGPVWQPLGPLAPLR